MTTDKTQAEVESPVVAALNRIADALERLADVYRRALHRHLNLVCRHLPPRRGCLMPCLLLQ